MARTPDGAEVRTESITTRMTPTDKSVLDTQRRIRGGMDRGTYIRWLIREDGKRISREKGRS